MIHPRCCGIPGCQYGSRGAYPPDPLVSYDRALRWPTRVLCVLVVLGMAFVAGHVGMRLV